MNKFTVIPNPAASYVTDPGNSYMKRSFHVLRPTPFPWKGIIQSEITLSARTKAELDELYDWVIEKLSKEE